MQHKNIRPAMSVREAGKLSSKMWKFLILSVAPLYVYNDWLLVATLVCSP